MSSFLLLSVFPECLSKHLPLFWVLYDLSMKYELPLKEEDDPSTGYQGTPTRISQHWRAEFTKKLTFPHCWSQLHTRMDWNAPWTAGSSHNHLRYTAIPIHQPWGNNGKRVTVENFRLSYLLIGKSFWHSEKSSALRFVWNILFEHWNSKTRSIMRLKISVK